VNIKLFRDHENGNGTTGGRNYFSLLKLRVFYLVITLTFPSQKLYQKR